MVRHQLKRLVHESGGFAAYHRVRNRRWLTVPCFHRVLPPSDPRWAERDPEWTISVDQLADTVAFAKRHFNPVSLDEVLDARRRSKALPPRPLLFTFDDGWADNEEYALPVFEAAGVPGLIFITSDAIGKKSPFWFETLRMARIGGRIPDDVWTRLWEIAGRPAPSTKDSAQLEDLIAILAKFSPARVQELFAPFASRLEDGRQHMVSVDQIKRLRARGFSIGTHGRTHSSLPHAENLDDELRQPKARLEEILGEKVTTLAFPHGRFTSEVLTKCKEAGYEMVFTGERELAPAGAIPYAVGRIPVTPEGLEDERGRFPADRLSADFFRCRQFTERSQLNSTRA